MRYVKPLIIQDSDMSEGIFTASGSISSCYSVEANIHQTPEPGREDYRIQVNAHHNGVDHGNSGQVLTISFNQPVTYSFSNGSLLSGNGTQTLQIGFSYWQNPNDNIGLGDLVVISGDNLAITSVVMTDDGSRW